MADRNIDQAKANAWIKDVKEEIASVRKVLREDVPATICDVPGNDTFTEMLKATNSFLSSTWDTTTKGFNDAWDKVEDALKETARVGAKVVGDLENLDGRVKRK